jgi:predicted enzyme related to lactoylglutathione lyase
LKRTGLEVLFSKKGRIPDDRDRSSQRGIDGAAEDARAGVGWLAYCKDTEGHIFGMMQNDPSAK